MAIQSSWRMKNDELRQNEIFAHTDSIMNDPSVGQDVKDARARDFKSNMSVRSKAKQPDFANIASVGRAVVNEAAGSSSSDDTEITGRRDQRETHPNIEGVPSYGKNRVNP